MSKYAYPEDLSTPDLVREHKELHRLTKAAPSDDDKERERSLCKELERRGCHPRYVDELAKASGTVPTAETPPPSLQEVSLYLQNPIGIDPLAVTVGQTLKSSELYLGISTPALRELSRSIIKAVQRELPDGVAIGLDEDMKNEDFVRCRALYALQLVPAQRRDVIITTAKSYMGSFRAAAASASRVFKTDSDPRVPFRITKKMTEGIVSGVVLEPEVPDGTVTKESDADIYDADEIYKAMVFWMENARAPFAYHHVDHGGRPLSPEDVVLLENWQARADFIEGEQTIRKGSWMMSTRIRHPQLLHDIEVGKINSWSLGLNCMAGFEEAA